MFYIWHRCVCLCIIFATSVRLMALFLNSLNFGMLKAFSNIEQVFFQSYNVPIFKKRKSMLFDN